ncbi:MAG: ATP-binding cassette domain-containing protein, partial [Verrucomicrobiota bacterium]
MRMITGYFPPTAGIITVGGANIETEPIEAKRKIGYLPENAPLYSELTVAGFLRFVAEMRGLSGAERGKAVDRAMDMCHLQGVRHQSVDTLSKGFRHRTCFAQSLLHDPDVLIMDEPTDGLDPNQKHEVRGLIKRMGEEKAIIFSTHILEEVEAVCSRAIIISNGEVVANGTPDDLKGKAEGAGSIRIHLVGGSASKEDLEKLGSVSKVEVLEQGDGALRALVTPRSHSHKQLSEDLFKYAVDKGAVLKEMGIQEGRLDDVFRQITISDTADSAAA